MVPTAYGASTTTASGWSNSINTPRYSGYNPTVRHNPPLKKREPITEEDIYYLLT